jgi:hypothetical protein
VTRAEISLRDQKRENDAVDVAMAEYRRLVPDAPARSHDADLALSAEVNRMNRGGEQRKPEMVLVRTGCVGRGSRSRATAPAVVRSADGSVKSFRSGRGFLRISGAIFRSPRASFTDSCFFRARGKATNVSTSCRCGKEVPAKRNTSRTLT